MHTIAFDTETALIRPAQLAPPLACVTQAQGDFEPRLDTCDTAFAFVQSWLASADTQLVGHNVAYDMAVVGARWPELLPAIFAAYDADRVTDTMLRQQLLDIASGTYRGRITSSGFWIKHEYSLEALAKRCAGMVLQKDAWRLSYGNFVGVPLAEWPAKALAVQAEAAIRIPRIEAELAAQPVTAPHEDDEPGGDGGGIAELLGTVMPITTKAGRKAAEKELEGLRSMVASDPSQCVTYPIEDAVATLRVFEQQEVHSAYLADQYRQARGAFWLYLSSAWGIRTDAQGVATLRFETEQALAEIEGDLKEIGLVRPDGSRDTKLAKRQMIDTCAREGRKLRRTKTHADNDGLTVAERKALKKRACCKLLDGTWLDDGDDACEQHISLDADACAASEDLILIDYAEVSTLKKVLGNDVVALEKGTIYPVHTRYGLAETGRTTSSKPNIQNLRRKAGIREAFIPRQGKILFAADYPQLELYTLAQCCVKWFGFSRLADALNAGLDPHNAVAAQILGISYADVEANLERPDVDNARQTAKVANFGFPGGLGIDNLILFARKVYKVVFDPDPEEAIKKAKSLKATWLATWPEMLHHFARVNALCNTPGGLATVETLFTKRFRGGATYCAACNNGFQGLGVDCAKEAGWLIAKAQYVETESVLFGSRTVAFVHDEFIGETEDCSSAHDVAWEQARLMVAGANIYLPDVQIKMSKMKPFLMRRWSKKAKPKHDSNNRLIPWD